MTPETDYPCWIALTDACLETSPVGYWNMVDCSVAPASGSFDPAMFRDRDTGLCIWKVAPAEDNLFALEYRSAGTMLKGRMALWRTDGKTDLGALKQPKPFTAGDVSGLAIEAVRSDNLRLLAEAVNRANSIQLEMGLAALPSALNALAYKYVGDRHDYAVYIFKEQADRDLFCLKSGALAVEPFYSQ